MLTIKQISKTFNPGTINEKKVLSNFSLHLEPGEFVTIIGSNGAGKSTLFNAISGSFLTDAGSIILDKQDITFLAQHKRSKYIGHLYQDPNKGTAPNMTILENLALAAGNGGWLSHISKEDKIKFINVLSQLNLGLEHRLNQSVGLLSGGQRQALALLMATYNPPKLLLLDEHTAALDPQTAKQVLDLTDKIVKKNNITTLMITHNMQDALSLGTRTIMMDNGNIILDVKGEERNKLTVDDLIFQFKLKSGQNLSNDRILLTK
ncbi:ABC transporter ATP-binding protein [Floccifex sp.]|uniref:ABC transporter ATP-binding protein n=1 Tax=Floccifex sp. TaxID=2815810 RepID=UPI003F04197C